MFVCCTSGWKGRHSKCLSAKITAPTSHEHFLVRVGSSGGVAYQFPLMSAGRQQSVQWKPRLEENQENTANRQWKKGTFGESGSRRYARACATTHPDMTAEFMELEERLDLSFEPSAEDPFEAGKPSCTMAFSYSTTTTTPTTTAANNSSIQQQQQKQ